KGNDVLNVDQGIVIVNNKLISGSEGNITYVKSISTAVSGFIAGVAVILTAAVAVAALVSSFGTGIFAVCAVCAGAVEDATGVAIFAVGASATVGGCLIFGVNAALIITSFQYNLQFNRIATTVKVISSCAIVGLFITGAVSAYACKSLIKEEEIMMEDEVSVNSENIVKNTNNIIGLEPIKNEPIGVEPIIKEVKPIKRVRLSYGIDERLDTESENRLFDHLSSRKYYSNIYQVRINRVDSNRLYCSISTYDGDFLEEQFTLDDLQFRLLNNVGV
ncbi:hypothetical protein, partial [uncultured Methanobrevibacter sp.]|uniref:hypothetical protein n=1 Tax=uncultured Methanobrevibacter sp. TaxID=253161 RepID=UPI0025EDC679